MRGFFVSAPSDNEVSIHLHIIPDIAILGQTTPVVNEGNLFASHPVKPEDFSPQILFSGPRQVHHKSTVSPRQVHCPYSGFVVFL